MTAPLAEGTIFAGRYRVGRRLAAGAMGAVYEAVHLDTHRRRALKVMHPHLFESDDMRERFQRETRIAANIESEYIVDVSDAGVDEATQMPFLVMELLRGEELGDRLKRLGRLPLNEVVTYLQQTAAALDRTHAQSIIHRDLKPANLFLTYRDDGTPRIKILDFGVAKVVADSSKSAGSTQILGTPLYMAPEQFQSDIRLTPAVDVHALGMMAYTLLVGEAYWSVEARRGADVIALAMIILRGPQEPATQRAAARGVALPPGFDAWFAKITAVNPADRFAGAILAINALGEALNAASIMRPAGPFPAPSLASSVPGTTVRAPLQSSEALLERAATSTGAAITAPRKAGSRRGVFTAALVTAGVVLLATAWLWHRSAMIGPSYSAVSTAPVIAEVPAAPASAAIEPAVVPPVAGSVSPPAARVEPSAVPRPPVVPAPGPPASSSPARGVATPVVQKKTLPKLFGRD
ncbi:MAG: protein kinase [Byssovorax sp.]